MNVHIEYQTLDLKNEGSPTHAVLPLAQLLDLLKLVKDEPTIPHEVVSNVVDGMPPIRAWREHKKLSQAEMAERLGVTQPTYQAKEKPDANMRRKTLEKIADALGITYGQLDI